MFLFLCGLSKAITCITRARISYLEFLIMEWKHVAGILQSMIHPVICLCNTHSNSCELLLLCAIFNLKLI